MGKRKMLEHADVQRLLQGEALEIAPDEEKIVVSGSVQSWLAAAVDEGYIREHQ